MKRNANPHFCEYLPGLFQVDSNKNPFTGAFSEVIVDKIRINYYWTRDEDFFYGDCLEREIDQSIFKYIPKLKSKIEFLN